MVRVDLDLGADAPDVGVHQSAVAEVLVPPHPLQQLVAAQHLVRVVGELAHEQELGLRQRHGLALAQNDALRLAHLEVAEAADAVARHDLLVTGAA